MNALIAPNAFKGTLTALEAGDIIAQTIGAKHPSWTIKIHPIADGGDGTCALLNNYLGLKSMEVWGLDALGRPIQTGFGWEESSKTAYIDVSAASGVGTLQEEEKNPKVASTFGTGLLIRKAAELGAKHIVLGLGGSATVDLGLGILQACGFTFLNEGGKELTPFSPGMISKLKHIQRSPAVPKLSFTCLCDVKNPFFGKQGAIPVFGPQKGLKNEDLKVFEEDAHQLIKILENKSKTRFKDQAGFGAAGGIALGLSFFFPLTISFGANYFFEKTGLESAVVDSDLIITGEGKYDEQSSSGKACFELLKLAKLHQKKIVLITSGLEAQEAGFDKVLTLPDLDFSHKNFKKLATQNLIQVSNQIED